MSVKRYNVVLQNVTSDKMNWDYAGIWDNYGQDDPNTGTITPWQTLEIINVFPTKNNGLKDTHVIHLFCNEDLKNWDMKAIGLGIAQRTEKILNSNITH
jgi:hypothetical protein